MKAEQARAQQEAWAEDMRRRFGDVAARIGDVAAQTPANGYNDAAMAGGRARQSPFDRLVSLVQGGEYPNGSPPGERQEQLSEISTPNVRHHEISTPPKTRPNVRPTRGKSEQDYENWPPHGEAAAKAPYRTSGYDEYRDSGYDEYRASGYDEYRSSGYDEYRAPGRDAMASASSVATPPRRPAWREPNRNEFRSTAWYQ